MEIGFVGLGRMGFNMTRRLLQGGHRVVATDLSPERVQEAVSHGAVAASTLAALVQSLQAPRVVWVMLPAGKITDDTIDLVAPLLSKGDLVVDGGNTNFHDDQRYVVPGENIQFAESIVEVRCEDTKPTPRKKTAPARCAP